MKSLSLTLFVMSSLNYCTARLGHSMVSVKLISFSLAIVSIVIVKPISVVSSILKIAESAMMSPLASIEIPG